MGEVVSGMGAMGVALGLCGRDGRHCVPDSLRKSLANTAWRSRMWNCGPDVSKEVGQFGFAARMAARRIDLRAHDARAVAGADEQSKEGAKPGQRCRPGR